MWSVVLGPKVLVRVTLLHLNRKASCALFLALVFRFRFSRTRVQVRSPFEWLRSVKKRPGFETEGTQLREEAKNTFLPQTGRILRAGTRAYP